MTAPRQHLFEIPDSLHERRLDAAIASLCSEYSRTSIKTWIEAGRVLLNGVTQLRPRETVYSGDRIELTATLTASDSLVAEDMPFEIVFEDETLLVVNKPAGLVVHPGAGNREHTLVNGLLHRVPALTALPRAGLVHRLDKDTSGLLLVAKSSGALQRLVAAMARRTIHRSYEAIVHGIVVAGGTVDAAVGRDRMQRTRMRVAVTGKTAVTHYRVLKRFRAHSHLELTLETGRTHQIRVHMQYLGYPLLGDPTYGTRRPLPDNAAPTLLTALASLQRQALHAKRLAFEHPASGELIELECPLPLDIRRTLRGLNDDLKRNQSPK